MTPEQFDSVLSERLSDIRHVLGAKGQEYARGDRLSNFKRAAAAA